MGNPINAHTAGGLIVSLFLFSSAPLARAAAVSEIDSTPTPDFLAHCAADQRWCGKTIVDVQIGAMLDQTLHNQTRSFCAPDPAHGQSAISWEDGQRAAVIGWIQKQGASAPATAYQAVLQAMNTLWPCP